MRSSFVWLFGGLSFLLFAPQGVQISNAALADTSKPAPTPIRVPTTARPERPLATEVLGETGSTPIGSPLELQIALAREGFSSGSIDGIRGTQTVAALRAFQQSNELPESGELDGATRERLVLKSPALTRIAFTLEDQAQLQPISPTWLGKSEQTALGYETIIELLAERTHASPALLRQLNPGVDWQAVAAGTLFIVPSVERTGPPAKAVRLQIRLSDRSLVARTADGKVLAYFPVSIARMAEKRPEGELRVTVVIPNPNYTFAPDVFPESEEGRQIGRKLVLPPGPNNPVGLGWIGLDRAGYGIHGTPLPESIGRTESHGCFRLANWDVQTLVTLAWVGMPVTVDP